MASCRWGTLFLAHPFFKTPRKPTFCAFLAKIRLKILSTKIFLGGTFLACRLGAHFFGRVGKPKYPPPAINNEQSLTRLITNFHHFCNSEIRGLSLFNGMGGYDFGGVIMFSSFNRVFSQNRGLSFFI